MGDEKADILNGTLALMILKTLAALGPPVAPTALPPSGGPPRPGAALDRVVGRPLADLRALRHPVGADPRTQQVLNWFVREVLRHQIQLPIAES